MEVTDTNIVIVVSTDNYKQSYSEEVPFKAEVVDVYDTSIVVKSLSSNKEYELYSHQILEFLDGQKMKALINLDTY